MQQALAGVRVVDMALLLPGALAATWLADLGASVVRVEPPWGGGLIGWDNSGPDPYFTAMRSNKELVRLNIRRPEEAQRLRALIEGADILIEGYRPGTLAGRGFGYEALSVLNPRLIYCSISGFGQSGERRGLAAHDNNYLALAGLLDRNRGRDGVPHLLPVQLADVGGGTYPALVAILAALYARERSGHGQHLDVAIFDGALAWNYFNIPAQPFDELESRGLGLGLLTGESLCYNVYECADGRYLTLGALEPRFWRKVCELLERPDLLPFAANPPPGAAERLAEFRALFRSRPRDEWLDFLGQKETLVSPLLTVEEVLADEYVQSRAVVVDEQGVARLRFPVRVRGEA